MKPLYPSLTLSLAMTAGCAGMPPATDGEPDVAAETRQLPTTDTVAPADATAPEVVAEPLTGPMLYHLLAGEIAGQRGRYGHATEFYAVAASESADPRVAERALRIAAFAKDDDAALAAARRWVRLAPADQQARRTLISLLIEAGDEDAALEQLRSLIAASDDPEAGFREATGSLARDSDRQRALRLMEALVADHPQEPEAVLALARMNVHTGDLQRARNLVEQALTLRDDWPEAALLQAHVLHQLEDLPAALSAMAAAARRYPEHGQIQLNHARLLLEKGDREAARRQFERAEQLLPENGDVLLALALIAMDAERHESARDYLQRLINDRHHAAAAQYYLGRLAEGEDQALEAMRRYEEVSNSDYWLDAQLRLARLLSEHDRLDQALHRLAAIRVRNPQVHALVIQVEADLLIRAEQLEDAMRLYDDALAREPDHSDLLYARALLAEELGRLDQAEADLRRLIELEPDNAHALNALGYTLADRTQRYDEALALVQRAIALAPDEPAIIDSLGWVYYRMGDHDQALKYLRQAFELLKDAEIGAHLGEVLWESGRQDEARRIWAQAAEDNPDDPVLRATRARYLP